MYIRQNTLRNRLGSLEKGLGESSRFGAVSPEELDAQAQTAEAGAAGLRQSAASLPPAAAANGAAMLRDAVALETKARNLHAQAAAAQRNLDQQAQADREKSQAIIGLSTNLLNVGANVGTAFMQADMARKAAKDAAKAAQGMPAPVTYVTQGGGGGGGLSTGAILGIVGGLAAVAILVVVMTKK